MRKSVRWFFLTLALCGFLVDATSAAGASSWTIGLHASSSGEATGDGLPAAPAASAACSGLVLGSIVITWGAVSTASSYTVYESTTSATSGFSVIATGVTATTYTVSGLLGSYWFEVAAVAGSNWQGANSPATAKRTITAILCS